MLEEILNYINNYFVVKDGVHKGIFNISSGTISLDFLQEGQYFCIKGSVFNDGVYQYPASGLTNEEFTGEVWAMAVPPSVIALVQDIEEWMTKYGVAMNSPFQSESFGGYSYSKGSYSSPTGESGSANWASVFKNRLNAWRKL